MQSFTHLVLPSGDGQGLCCVFDVYLCLCVSQCQREREGGRETVIDRWRDRKSLRELSVPVYGNTWARVQQSHCSQWEGLAGGRVNPSSAAGRGCFEFQVSVLGYNLIMLH